VTNKAIIDSILCPHCVLPSPPFPADNAFSPHNTTTVLRPFFWDYLGEPVPEENFWTLWCIWTLWCNNAFFVGKKTPSRRQVMWPIVNMPDEDRATDIGNMHKEFGKDYARSSGDIRQTDRQTDRHRQTDRQTRHTDPQTDILITILRNCSRGWSNNM